MEIFKLFGKIAVDNSEANRAIDETAKQSKKIGSSFNESQQTTSKSLKQIASESGKTVNEIKSDAMKLAAEYKKQGMTQSEANKKAYADMGYVAKETHKKVNSEVDETTDTYKDSSEKIKDTVNDTAEKTESSMTKALKKIGAAVVAAFAVDKIKDFGKACISAGMDFDSQMSTVAAISGATGEEFEILRAKAQEMGATTAFSATESAQAMEYMAMAGWKTTDITNGLAGVMNLAAASGEDLATTSDIVTDAMTAFGMSADQSTYFADVLAQTATNANTNVGMMGETFKYVAPLAGAMGYNIEDMSAAIGLMANAGIKGSQSGTSLRNIITNLASPTDKVAGAMDDLGISLTDSDGKTKSFGETLSDLRISFADLDEVQKTQYASAIAGKEGMSGLLALINSSDEDFDKLTDSIKNCTGASEEMAEIRLDNLEGDVTLFKSALEGAQIAISDKLTPVLRNLVKKATDWLPKIQKSIIAVIDKLEDKFGPLIKRIKNIAEESDITEKSISFLKEAFEKTVDVISEIGDKFLDFIEWITGSTNGAEGLRSVIKGLTAGFLAYKGAMIATNSTVRIGTKVVEAYRKAQQLLNSTSPFGWVVLAVSGLVALETTLRGLPTPTEKITEEFSKLDDEEQALVDHIKELTDEYNSWADSRDKTISDTGAEFDYYQQLTDELQTITDKNGEVKKGYEDRAEFIVTTLNDSLGTEIEMTDGVIQKYEDIMSTIDEVIEKKKAEAMLSALEQDYADAIANVNNAQEAYYKEAENVNKTKSEMATVQSALNDLEHMSAEEIHRAYGEMADAGTVTADLNAKLEGLNNQLDTHEAALNEAEDAYFDYNSTIQNYEGLSSAIISGDTTTINDALLKMTKGFLTAETADAKSLERQTSNLKEEVANMKTALKNGMPGVTQEQIDQLENLVNESEKEWQKALGDVTDFTGNVRNELNVDYSAEGSNAMTTWGNGAVSAAEGVITTLSGLRDTFSSLMSGYSVNVSTAEIVASTKKLTGHAKGGIVTREHVARVGEDGAEAIVPLENNTEWIDKVAAKVTDSMGGAPSNTAILNKLNELIEVIKGQKVYLDSGALVGEIAPAMDGALGNISRMKRRGLR